MLERISDLRDEVESRLDISIPLWFENPGSMEENSLSDSEIASGLPGRIDHTLLRLDADSREIERLCDEAVKYRFYSVCVYSDYVKFCRDLLRGSNVKICSVAGFPSGAVLPSVKALEAEEAVRAGANEIDVVINIAALKENNLGAVHDDICAVVKAAGDHAVIKAILETGYLTEDEKIRGCLAARAAGAKFVKTSTGFGPSGANVDDVRLLRTVVGPDFGVKAAGGIRDSSAAMAMIRAGASRIGTSASINIIAGLLRSFGPNCMRSGE